MELVQLKVFFVGRVVGLVRVVLLGKKLVVWLVLAFLLVMRFGFLMFLFFFGHRSENGCEKTSVGRVVGSVFDRSEQKQR